MNHGETKDPWRKRKRGESMGRVYVVCVWQQRKKCTHTKKFHIVASPRETGERGRWERWASQTGREGRG